MKMSFLLVALVICVGFAPAQESPHGPLNMACQTCHSTDSWQMRTDGSFDHSSTGFKLEGQHKSTACVSCHVGLKFSEARPTCNTCHSDVHKGEEGENCLKCHTPQSWKVADMVQKHQETQFTLLGKHRVLTCESCHANSANYQYRGTPVECISCHQTDYTSTTNPSHSTAGFSTDCISCHDITSTTWDNGFDHKLTAFPLTGAHVATPCSQCHVNGKFKGTPAQCVSCHQTDFNTTTNPNHVQGNFPTNCVQCHTTTAWRPATFNHSATHFPLTGEHSRLQCQSCHKNGNYNLTYTGCNQCHSTNFAGTTNPNHVTLNFNRLCESCHTTTNWASTTYDHSTTNFPLTGKHVQTQCQSCHLNNNYQLTYSSCIQCHQPDYQATTSPSHATLNYPQTCQTCHTTAAWIPSSFSHNATNFALTGKHTIVQCQSCHVNNNYQLTYSSCYQCHQSDFTGTTNPNHVTQNFSQTCLTCHTTAGWSPASFDHNATNFSLTGKHTQAQCQSCHINNNYQLTYSSCVQCHQPDYQATTSPSHATLNYPQTCQTCHTTAAWIPSSFDHNATNFALTGKHTIVQCQSCHVNNNYQLTYSSCYQCHQSDFTGTTNPNHVTQNFSQTCLTCHTTAGWSPASFDHNATNFSLTGKHTQALCQSCHVNNNYQLTYTSCYQCHQPDYQATTSPSHATLNYPQTCQTCHTTTAWIPSSFDHNATNFALTGKHTIVQCQSCHVNNNYQLTYSSCYQCHQSDFTGTTNPNHVTQNFSQTCLTCHTTAGWSPASFDHNTTNFALTGKHTQALCQSCHVNNNYQLTYTSCYQCHQPDFQATTNPNHVTGNYPQTCLTCHTTTAWVPATFDHNTTNFPLTGKHTQTLCQSCHVNNNYQLTYTSCYQCHQPDYAGTTNPNHVTLNFSQSCQTCHTTTAWIPSTFNHDSQYFRIYSGRHLDLWTLCTQCHTDINNYANYTCFNCHAHDRAIMDPKHSQVNGYSYSSPSCYSCHRRV